MSPGPPSCHVSCHLCSYVSSACTPGDHMAEAHRRTQITQFGVCGSAGGALQADASLILNETTYRGPPRSASSRGPR